jgi:hypothetical protein
VRCIGTKSREIFTPQGKGVNVSIRDRIDGVDARLGGQQ